MSSNPHPRDHSPVLAAPPPSAHLPSTKPENLSTYPSSAPP
ncbi:unnamed protein product, partial [Didymodactylos carnosus]